ncbi:MAG: hypothetical protein IJU20_00015 [Clostridia bacterium]|nr:hypothetical protein [Clostridia bacterium]
MRKLIFSIENIDSPEKAKEAEELFSRVSGYNASIDMEKGQMSMEIPNDTDISQLGDSLEAVAAANGFSINPTPRFINDTQTDKPKTNFPKISFPTFIVAIILAILVSTLTTFALFRKAYSPTRTIQPILNDSTDVSTYADVSTFASIFKTYSMYDLDDEEMINQILKAFCRASGDYFAEYYTDEEYRQLNESDAGHMVGIGVSCVPSFEIEYKGKTASMIQVVRVYPDSPAEKGGLLPDDLVIGVKVNGTAQLITESTYDTVLNLIRGEEGTPVTLILLRREGEEEEWKELELTLTREAVTVLSVSHRISTTDPTVGIISIEGFDFTTPTGLKDAMNDLLDSGIEKFVFDLRFNPGGDLRSIEAILSYFLEEGDLMISTKDKSGYEAEDVVKQVYYSGAASTCSVKAEEIGMYRGYKYAVLVNGNTASAAELFTSNFRDYELGKIVGTKTFGKGSMQSIFSLSSYGIPGAIKLTTRYYYPPSGEGYNGIGIYPSEGYSVELSEEAQSINHYLMTEEMDNQLQTAIQSLYD